MFPMRRHDAMPNLSVGGEIIPLKKSILILTDIIKWNYPFFVNQITQQTNERGSQHSSPNKRQRRDELERTAQKFESRQMSFLNRPVTRRGDRNQVQINSSRLDTLSSALRSVQGEFS